jgi:hypothetical protein
MQARLVGAAGSSAGGYSRDHTGPIGAWSLQSCWALAVSLAAPTTELPNQLGRRTTRCTCQGPRGESPRPLQVTWVFYGPEGSHLTEATRYTELVQLIRRGVAEGMAALPPHLRAWAEAHLVEPRPIRAALDADGQAWSEFLLVTDDIGRDDSSCRVVYDPTAELFGTVTQVQGGPLWYLGPDDSFHEAVTNM